MRRLLLFLALATTAFAQETTTIFADTLFDGKGGVVNNVAIIVRGDKIEQVLTPAAKPRFDASRPKGTHVVDLAGLTVMPGWIDTHVHITWHFGPHGHFA